ncbi:MAG: substrate-binding domain-containing protein, partial [Maribacter sp.]
DRVLHKRSGVSKETEKRVLEIIKKTGYVKNTTASRLKLASVKKIKIAILIPKGENTRRWSYWELPKKGILKAVDELSELGVEAAFYNFSDSISFADQSEAIFEENYDAIVTVPFFVNESNDLLDLAKSKKIPVVFLDTEIALDGPSNFIRQNSYNAGMVAGRLLYGLVGNEGQYFIVNIINDKGVHANGKQREDGFRAFFKTIGQHVNIQTINHPINVDFAISKEMEDGLKKTTPKGIFVTNSRSHLIPPLLKKHNISKTFVVGFDLNDKNMDGLKNNEINFIINQKPKYQGYAAIKGVYNFLTTQDASSLNLDIPIDIIVKENIADT